MPGDWDAGPGGCRHGRRDLSAVPCTGDKGQQWKVTTTSDLAGELVNPNSGLCLADPADSTTNGTQMVIESCAAADPGESWHIR
jgi:hypothetical protein